MGVRRRLTQPLARRLTLSWCRRLHAARRRLAPGRYTDCDPFRLISVDPDTITHSLLESAPKYPQWGRVVGGDWDQHGEPFADRSVSRGLRQRFAEGRPWDETALFDAFVDQLERFGNAWGYRSLAGFDARCAEIEALSESLNADGYRRQERLATVDTPRLAHRADEIGVDIGRDGEIYWRAYGQHRLALAQLLGLDSVWVVVHRRHRRWQARRDRLRNEPQNVTNTSHPDLASVSAVSR